MEREVVLGMRNDSVPEPPLLVKLQPDKLIVSFPPLYNSNHSPCASLTFFGLRMISLMNTCCPLGGGLTGALVGALLGALLGALVGIFDGALVGDEVGVFVGALVGLFDGPLVGVFVGDAVGDLVGADVGPLVGAFDGAFVGIFVGADVGGRVGTSEHLFAAPGVPLSPEATHGVVELHQLSPSWLTEPSDSIFKDMEAPSWLGKGGPLPHSTRSTSSPASFSITIESTSSRANPPYPVLLFGSRAYVKLSR
jgi:hypothetical protein